MIVAMTIVVVMMTVEDLLLVIPTMIVIVDAVGTVPSTAGVVTAHHRTVVEVAVAAEAVRVLLPATVVEVAVLLVDTRTRVDTMTIVETVVIAEIVVEDVMMGTVAVVARLRIVAVPVLVPGLAEDLVRIGTVVVIAIEATVVSRR